MLADRSLRSTMQFTLAPGASPPRTFWMRPGDRAVVVERSSTRRGRTRSRPSIGRCSEPERCRRAILARCSLISLEDAVLAVTAGASIARVRPRTSYVRQCSTSRSRTACCHSPAENQRRPQAPRAPRGCCRGRRRASVSSSHHRSRPRGHEGSSSPFTRRNVTSFGARPVMSRSPP